MHAVRRTAGFLSVALVLVTCLGAQNASRRGGPPQQQFQEALSHYQSGQYALAAGELEALAQKIPPSFQVDELLGHVLSDVAPQLAGLRRVSLVGVLHGREVPLVRGFLLGLDLAKLFLVVGVQGPQGSQSRLARSRSLEPGFCGGARKPGRQSGTARQEQPGRSGIQTGCQGRAG